MLGFYPLGAHPLGASGEALKARGTGTSAGVAAAVAYPIVDAPGAGVKRAGVCFPSYGREATFSSSSPWSADFPLASLAFLDDVRRVAVRSDAGATVIDFLLPQTRLVDFIGLIHHNGDRNARITVQLSSGTDPTASIVHQGLSQPVWGNALPVAGYLPVRPYRLDAAVNVRSGRITLSANTDPWEIGAIEIGQWWSWLDVGVDRGIGIESSSETADVAGVDHVTLQWGARLATGRRDVVDQVEVDELLLDFHRARGRDQAFVWCWDVDDSGTWAREAWLARNRTMPPGVVHEDGVGRMRYDFLEHLG